MIKNIKSNKISKFIFYLIVFTTFSGAVRKWGTSGGIVNNLILAVQLVSPLLIFYISEPLKKENSKTLNLLFLYFILLAVFAVNPLNHTFTHGLLGIIIHSSLFLILFSYFFKKEEFDIEPFMKLLIAICIFQVFIASVQYVSPGSAWINRYAATNDEGEFLENNATVGDAIRASGTFSYIAGYTSFIYFFLFIVLYRLKKLPENLWNFPLIGLVLYGALLSGSRGSVVFTGFTLLVYLILETKFIQKGYFVKFGIASVLLLIINTGLNDPIGIVERLGNSLDNFIVRWDSNSEEGEGRMFQDISAVFFNNFDYKLTGIGLGATYQGANAIFGKSPLLSNVRYEGELFRTILEGGYLLLILRLTLLGFILSKLSFNPAFKLYLFIWIGIYTMFVFSIYNAIFLAAGIAILNSAYITKNELQESK